MAVKSLMASWNDMIVTPLSDSRPDFADSSARLPATIVGDRPLRRNPMAASRPVLRQLRRYVPDNCRSSPNSLQSRLLLSFSAFLASS
jgi:hypothetical protein